jgi:6-phosphogluconolactonase/glucosamine-6-phosphate isomerase/deaminase
MFLNQCAPGKRSREEDTEDDELNEYEQKRADNIKRNAAILRNLGIDAHVATLKNATTKVRKREEREASKRHLNHTMLSTTSAVHDAQVISFHLS